MKRLISTLNLSKEDWLRYRKCGITGTDAGAILGLNPYRSAFQVYHDKISDTIENIDNEAMRQGRDLEDYYVQLGERLRMLPFTFAGQSVWIVLLLYIRRGQIMTFNAMTEHYEEITVCGKPALFTSIRIKRDTIPDGLYAYDVRHDDECRGIPCEIAPFVMVNHWGTIILAEPLELPDDGRRYIDEDTDWDYSPLEGEGTADHEPCTTIFAFMAVYGHQKLS